MIFDNLIIKVLHIKIYDGLFSIAWLLDHPSKLNKFLFVF